MKKILITGFTGMLGHSIVKKLANNPNNQLFGIARNGDKSIKGIQQIIGDLTEQSFITSLKFLNPEVIIHTMALVDLNLCESNQEKAAAINIETSRVLPQLFPNAHFIYISTDSVFNGLNGNYREQMPTFPLNYYAFTKRAGELAVQSATQFALILRTNIYGHKASGKSLFDWAYLQLKKQQTINGFDDVYFNPLYTEQVAEIIETILIEHPLLTGIFHLGCEENINKYEFLKMVSEVFEFDQQLIKPTSIKKLKSKIKRPLNTTLNTSKFRAVCSKRYSLREGLKALKSNLKAA